VTHDQNSDDLRGLFDWRNAAARVQHRGATTSSAVENDDLALALRLLSCNFRDRQQFVGSRAGAATAS
jgi:hypothetical protein